MSRSNQEAVYKQLVAKGMHEVHRLVAAQVLSCLVITHLSASSLTRLKELALATVRYHVVALAAKLGIAAVDRDAEVEERIARAAAATVLNISAMRDGAM